MKEATKAEVPCRFCGALTNYTLSKTCSGCGSILYGLKSLSRQPQTIYKILKEAGLQPVNDSVVRISNQ